MIFLGACSTTYYLPLSSAASVGTVSFAFFKAALSLFMIGGYSAATTGYQTNKIFSSASGDGMFNSDGGIAYDASHDIFYIADQGNSRIVKITASTGAFIGVLGKTTASTGTCPASGTASGWCTGGTFTAGAADGMFNQPLAVALDVTNDLLYIADTSNHRVVKVTASTGAFVGAIGKTTATTGTCPASGAAGSWCTGGTFAAGASDGMFNTPRGMAIDVSGNALYITESLNNRITKITASSGAFVGAIGKTTATTGTCPASGAAGSWCTGGTFAAGASDGMFNAPRGVALDVTNNLFYVADSGNNRIMKVTASTGAFVGAIGKTTATTGTCPASGAAGSWCTGGTFAAGASDGTFNTPKGVAIDVFGNALYVADTLNNRAARITASTGAFVGAIGDTTASSGTCPASGAASGWCTGGTFAAGAGDGMLSGLFSFAVDSANGLLYITDSTNSRVVKVTASTGAFVGALGAAVVSTSGWASPAAVTLSPSSIDGSYFNPWAVAVDSSGNVLYVTDVGNNRIVKLTASTGQFVGAVGRTSATIGSCPSSGTASGWCTGGTFTSGATDGGFNFPTGLAVDSTNDILFVADQSNNRVVKLTASTGAFIGAIGNTTASTGTCPASGAASGWCTGGTFASGAGDGMFSNPSSFAFDLANDILYISDKGNHRIVKVVASTGAFIGAIGNTTASTGTCPASGGVAYIWCTGGTFALGTSDGMFNSLEYLALDTVNNVLFITDYYNNRIVKITASTGAFTGAIGNTTASTGTCPASGAASGWCTGGTFAAGVADGMFKLPAGIAYYAAGNALYVTDNNTDRVMKFTASTGAFVGAMGNLSGASSGTCPASGVATTWCTGGAFVLPPDPFGSGTLENSRGTFSLSNNGGNAGGTLDNQGFVILVGDTDPVGIFKYPVGIAVDTARNAIYIADTCSNRIQKAPR